jgi:hypothetical protein
VCKAQHTLRLVKAADEQFSATDEYLEKHGHLRPPEMTESGAARIRANFLKVLAQHPQILQKTRRLGR